MRGTMSTPAESDVEERLNRLMGELRLLLAQQDRLSRDKWNRSLPLSEHIGDRWERAKSLGFGEGASIYDSAVVLGDVRVGRNTWVGPFTILDGSGGLAIGDNCSISAGVHIYSHDTVDWALSGGTVPAQRAPVRIGNNCYIGPHSIISKGVTVGDSSVIGANSFVNRDVPEGARVWGSPASVHTIPAGG